MIFAGRFKEFRLFNCTEKKTQKVTQLQWISNFTKKGGRGREHHLLKSFGRKRNNQKPSPGIRSEFEVENMF